MSNKEIGKTPARSSGENPLKTKTKGQTAKELTDIHLHDKNHVITDDDIKNLSLDFNAPDTDTSHTPEIENDGDRPKDEDKDHAIVTPWNLIDQ